MLDALGLPASQCLAFEDSNNGLRAATAAGLATLITPNPFTAHHDFTGALKVVPDMTHIDLARLQQWHTACHA
jgi:beta-phosphoglucomutase-like phosphatase (HAD superfamily)